MTSSKFDKNRTQGTVWCIGATRSTVGVERVLGPSFPPLPTTSRNACFSAPNLGLWEWEGGIGRCVPSQWLPWKSPLQSWDAVFLHTTRVQPGKANLAELRNLGKNGWHLVPYSNLPEILPQKNIIANKTMPMSFSTVELLAFLFIPPPNQPSTTNQGIPTWLTRSPLHWLLASPATAPHVVPCSPPLPGAANPSEHRCPRRSDPRGVEPGESQVAGNLVFSPMGCQMYTLEN